jgi:hypothetical protein
VAVDSRLCHLIDIGRLASAARDAWLAYIVLVGLEMAGEETISSWFPTQRVKERGPRRSMGMGPLYGRWTVRTTPPQQTQTREARRRSAGTLSGSSWPELCWLDRENAGVCMILESLLTI